MSNFLNKFLLGSSDTEKPQVYLSAFGKHPGWNDHIEEIGIETETLAICRSTFYVQAIGGIINSGKWDKAEESKKTLDFDHLFLWHRLNEFLFGLMWPSKDGKGRKKYPMIVCAHCVGLPLSWGITHVLPKLNEVKELCSHTESASIVRSTLTGTRDFLRSTLKEQPPNPDGIVPLPKNINSLINHPSFEPQREGLIRILYQFNNQFSIYGLDLYNPKNITHQGGGDHIRFPLAAESPEEGIALWVPFLRTQIDPEVPLLLIVPREKKYGWCDAVFGEVTHQSLFCLKASTQLFPLASEIPYNLSQEFLSESNTILDNLLKGDTKSLTNIFKSSEAQKQKKNSLEKIPFFKRFLNIKFLLISVAIIIVIFLSVCSIN